MNNICQNCTVFTPEISLKFWVDGCAFFRIYLDKKKRIHQVVCYCKAGINYPSFPPGNQRISLCYFFARKHQAVHLPENACGKRAFRQAFPGRYRAGARDRDGAKRNRGAQHGVRQGSGSPRPRWSEAESRCAAVDVFAGKKVPENKKEEKQ